MRVAKPRMLISFLLLVVALTAGCAGPVPEKRSLAKAQASDIAAGLLAADTQADIIATEGATDGEPVTPFQQQLSNMLQDRAEAGLPTPSSVTFEYELVPPQQVTAENGHDADQVVTITAKTVLHFDSPEEAGYDIWPALVVTGTLPAGAHGSVLAGDYSELYRTLLAEQIPGIWEQVEFGREPRTHTVSETLNVLVPAETTSTPMPVDLANADTTQAILMGLTYTGPQIDYVISDNLTVRDFTVYDYVAGVELDWTLGLRLPADVMLSTLPVDENTAGAFASALIPADWSAEQYTAAGVAPEDGNEFLLRLDAFVGVKAILLEINVCPVCYVETRVDESASFATPFGPDTALPIPQIAVPIWNGNLGFAAADVGLVVSPQIGSTRITANWQAASDTACEQSGRVSYVAPAMPVTFRPESPCQEAAGSEYAVELTEFRYWLDRFFLGLNMNLDTRIFGYDLWSGTPLPINVNLSPFSQFFHLGSHKACNWRFQCEPTDEYDAVRLSYQEE